MANTNPAHVVLTNVRLSYTHLTEPWGSPGSDKKRYGTTILVPKASADNKAKIDAAIRAATEAARAKYGAAFPAQPKHSVHDGDGVRPSDGQPFGPECRGCWVFTASSDIRPMVVDGNLQDILDPTAIYSGMYANVGVSFFGYNNPQNKGIGVSLDNVQKIADGEPLGFTRASVEDDFQPLSAEPQQGYSTYPPEPQQGYSAYPPAGQYQPANSMYDFGIPGYPPQQR